MYLSLVITFLLLLGLIIAAVQNSVPVGIKFFTWNFQTSLLAMIFYSALIGGAIVALLTLPKLVSKSLMVRRLNREIYVLRKNALDLEKDHDPES